MPSEEWNFINRILPQMPTVVLLGLFIWSLWKRKIRFEGEFTDLIAAKNREIKLKDDAFAELRLSRDDWKSKAELAGMTLNAGVQTARVLAEHLPDKPVVEPR